MKEIVLTKVAGGAKKRSVLLSRRSYNSWRGMIERCTNPNHQHYSLYGGSGIAVCERWMKYAEFFADMGEPAERRMQLDRIDPAKGYSMENCRWVTPSQNCANRRGWNSLGLKGVSRRPSGRFAAVMHVNGKMITVGTYDDPETAAKAFDLAHREWFGDYARTNQDMGKVTP